MPIFQLRYPDGRTENVEGDETSVENSGAICIHRDVLVAGKPRRIVARRVHASEGLIEVEVVQGPK